jgi:cell division protein FtsI/penicillin-binding protein 2
MPRHARRAVALCLVALAASATAEAAVRKARRSRERPRPAPPALVVASDASDDDRLVAEAARRGLGAEAGSVVAMDPWSGRVIAVANPAYAVGSSFQPCSVFKIVVAIAGLTEGVITRETTIDCNGGCWMWPGHGPIDLRRALAVSCNPFFERVGERLGYAKVREYARLLGLGAPSGINLEGETAGRVPEAVRADRVGHLSSHAAGIATTGVQLGVLLSATINGGVVFRPQVAPAAGFVPKERWRLPAGTVLAGLTQGFLSAVNEGSAATAFDPKVLVAGKTGTCASVGWFASYAPADRPSIVIVVFLRRGNGHDASTVAGRIYQELFRAPAASSVAAGAQ